jgi:hypothetical protein
VPETALVGLLEWASTVRELRTRVAAVGGMRAAWLAALNPNWSWFESAVVGAGVDDELDVDEWARQPDATRVEVLRQRREREPAAALVLLRSTWATDPAAVRAAHLGVLRRHLSADDEDVLERALDDRGRTVREVAVRLLDGVPTSARAQRMADRLAPLVTIEGTRRTRRILVADPVDPDDAAVRDGLTPPPDRSARGWWLRRLTAGAPLSLWTDIAGAEPGDVVSMIDDSDVLAGLADAAVARHDELWAIPLFRRTRLPSLLGAARPDVREALVVERIAQPVNPPELNALLGHVGDRWSAPFCVAVIKAIQGRPNATSLLDAVPGGLGSHLDHDSVPAIERWLGELDEQTRLSRQLRAALQYESLRRSISEAFR